VSVLLRFGLVDDPDLRRPIDASGPAGLRHDSGIVDTPLRIVDGRRRIQRANVEIVSRVLPVPAWVPLLALYALMWGVLIWHVGARPDRDNRPAPWPTGVQEGDPVHYAVDALTPPSPPEPIEAVGTSAVRAHVAAARR
jgi:hypothetical protein